MRSNHQPSACTIFRPDAAGHLVAVATAKPAPAVARQGAIFGVWLGQSESWANEQPMTLDAAAELAAFLFGDAEVLLYGSYPRPLNAAERREVRALIREGSE